MVKFVIPIIAGIALSAPAIAQDAYHVRVGDRLYDIRTGSASDGVLVTGPSRDGLEKVREALVAAGCLRPDEADLSRHDCYINHDGSLVHRPARDSSGRPQGATALCLDGTYSFSQHITGTCSYHGGVRIWLGGEQQPAYDSGIYSPGAPQSQQEKIARALQNRRQHIYDPADAGVLPPETGPTPDERQGIYNPNAPH